MAATVGATCGAGDARAERGRPAGVHNYSLLHRKTVTWKVLREVIEDTETREKAVAVAKTRAAKKTDAAKPQAAHADDRDLAKPLPSERIDRRRHVGDALGVMNGAERSFG